MEVPKEKTKPWVSEIPSEESWVFCRDGLDIYRSNRDRASRLEPPSPYNLGRWPVCVCASKSLIGAAGGGEMRVLVAQSCPALS